MKTGVRLIENKFAQYGTVQKSHNAIAIKNLHIIEIISCNMGSHQCS